MIERLERVNLVGIIRKAISDDNSKATGDLRDCEPDEETRFLVEIRLRNNHNVKFSERGDPILWTDRSNAG